MTAIKLIFLPIHRNSLLSMMRKGDASQPPGAAEGHKNKPRTRMDGRFDSHPIYHTLLLARKRTIHKILLSANGTALKGSIGEKCNNKNRHALLARLLRPWLAVVVLLVAYPQHASLQLRHPHYDVLINSRPVTVFRHSIPC